MACCPPVTMKKYGTCKSTTSAVHDQSKHRYSYVPLFRFLFLLFTMMSFLWFTRRHKVKTYILHYIKHNLIPEEQIPWPERGCKKTLFTGLSKWYLRLLYLRKRFINLFNMPRPISATLLIFDQSEVALKPVKTLLMSVFPRWAPVAA